MSLNIEQVAHDLAIAVLTSDKEEVFKRLNLPDVENICLNYTKAYEILYNQFLLQLRQEI